MISSKKIQTFINNARINYDLPGLGVGIKINDESYYFGAGLADVVTSAPLARKSVFHMASVSKLFTSTGILILQDEGKLDINDNLTDILPWIKIRDERAKKIKLIHMLTHTSGMPDTDHYDWDKPKINSSALHDYAGSGEVTDMMLLWDPGTGRFSYSNIAYEILGTVISEVSGMTFEDFIKARILDKLKMDDSTFLSFERTAFGRELDPDTATSVDIAAALDLDTMLESGMAMPHMKDDDNHIIRYACYPYNREHGPSSTLTSTSDELFKFGDAWPDIQAVPDGTAPILSDEARKAAWEKYTTVPNNDEGMGLGWFTREQNGYNMYGHEGTDDGFRASFWICPEFKVQIVVNANISRAPVKKINKQIFDMIVQS